MKSLFMLLEKQEMSIEELMKSTADFDVVYSKDYAKQVIKSLVYCIPFNPIFIRKSKGLWDIIFDEDKKKVKTLFDFYSGKPIIDGIGYENMEPFFKNLVNAFKFSCFVVSSDVSDSDLAEINLSKQLNI
ncbi:hypothetical protein ACHJH3_06685 [Campylobacter sp. MOP7]|uniref:hypothetical protein n=1 Tax=Campylobacter canis TaxID=3378588 RepID=UPI00387E6239